MTSETVAVELEGLERLANDSLGGDPKRALLHSVARLRQLLASDFQAEECGNAHRYVGGARQPCPACQPEQGGDEDWPDELTIQRETLDGRTTAMFVIPPSEVADRSADPFCQVRRYTPAPPPQAVQGERCGGRGKLATGVNRDFDSGMLEADDEKPCPGCPDCQPEKGGEG